MPAALLLAAVLNAGSLAAGTGAAGAPGAASRVRCGIYSARVVAALRGGATKQVEILRDGRVAANLPAGVAAGVRCADLTADGRPDLLIESFTGGAHCCSQLRIVDLSGSPRPVFRFESKGGVQALKDLDGDVDRVRSATSGGPHGRVPRNGAVHRVTK